MFEAHVSTWTPNDREKGEDKKVRRIPDRGFLSAAGKSIEESREVTEPVMEG